MWRIQPVETYWEMFDISSCRWAAFCSVGQCVQRVEVEEILPEDGICSPEGLRSVNCDKAL